MNCPDWQLLASGRDDGGEGESAWMDALEHRRECTQCHDAALQVDPTLLFLDLPEVETTEEDIRAMQERVAISRRFAEKSRPAEEEPLEQRGWSRWLAAAAAIAFVGLGALVQGPFGRSPEEPTVQAALTTLVEDAAAPSASLAEHLEALPLVEGGDVRYQVSGDTADYAVVVASGVDL